MVSTVMNWLDLGPFSIFFLKRDLMLDVRIVVVDLFLDGSDGAIVQFVVFEHWGERISTHLNNGGWVPV